jgi:hypothetical protein
MEKKKTTTSKKIKKKAKKTLNYTPFLISNADYNIKTK